MSGSRQRLNRTKTTLVSTGFRSSFFKLSVSSFVITLALFWIIDLIRVSVRWQEYIYIKNYYAIRRLSFWSLSDVQCLIWCTVKFWRNCVDIMDFFRFILQGNLQQWLMDPHCYDQFSVIYEGGDRTAIFLNTPGEPTEVEVRDVGCRFIALVIIFQLSVCASVHVACFRFEITALDGDICSVVATWHLPVNISPKRNRVVGWREHETDSTVQPPWRSAGRLLSVRTVGPLCWHIIM